MSVHRIITSFYPRRLSWQKSPASRVPHEFCASCANFIIDEDHLGGEIPESPSKDRLPALEIQQGIIKVNYKLKDIYPQFPLLNRSVVQGCEFCSLIKEAINRDQKHHAAEWGEKFHSGARVRMSAWYKSDPEHGNQSFAPGEWPTMFSALEICIANMANHLQEPLVIVLKLSGDPGRVSNYLRISRRPLQPQTITECNMRLVFRWIDKCVRNHEICKSKSPFTHRIPPTRLIQLGRTETDDARLMDTSGLFPRHIQYAALSYCWGSNGPRLTTIRENLAQRLRGLSTSALPPTFRDAFKVARILKIRYLWIDSLCIVQDDPTDWQREAMKMGDIYQAAYITLVSAAARSTNDGFLKRIRPTHVVAVPFQSSRHPDVTGRYYVSPPSPSRNGELFYEDVTGSAWNNRGWTFQERLLSQRLLFFGENALHFECRTLRWSEGYDGDLKRTNRLLEGIQKGSDTASLRQSWEHLIREYSYRSFTFNNDKLPALSSLAAEVAKALSNGGVSSSYLGGLWTSDLPGCLLWVSSRLPGDINKQNSKNVYIAPSWSWCSAKGIITWPLYSRENAECECSVLKTSLRLGHNDHMGRLRGGSITLHGFIATYQPTTIKDEKMVISYAEKYWLQPEVIAELYFDAGLPEDIKRYARMYTLKFFLLTSVKFSSRKHGLILVPQSLRYDDSKIYQRIGVFVMGTLWEKLDVTEATIQIE